MSSPVDYSNFFALAEAHYAARPSRLTVAGRKVRSLTRKVRDAAVSALVPAPAHVPSVSAPFCVAGIGYQGTLVSHEAARSREELVKELYLPPVA